MKKSLKYVWIVLQVLMTGTLLSFIVKPLFLFTISIILGLMGFTISTNEELLADLNSVAEILPFILGYFVWNRFFNRNRRLEHHGLQDK